MVKEIIRDGCQYPRRQSKGASCLHVSTRARPRPSAKHEVIGYKKRSVSADELKSWAQEWI